MKKKPVWRDLPDQIAKLTRMLPSSKVCGIDPKIMKRVKLSRDVTYSMATIVNNNPVLHVSKLLRD